MSIPQECLDEAVLIALAEAEEAAMGAGFDDHGHHVSFDQAMSALAARYSVDADELAIAACNVALENAFTGRKFTWHEGDIESVTHELIGVRMVQHEGATPGRVGTVIDVETGANSTLFLKTDDGVWCDRSRMAEVAAPYATGRRL